MNQSEKIVIFSQTNFRNKPVKFGIKMDDRRRHMYVLGKTGMGKTNLLETMIIQDILRGKGLAVVDPHGELVENILKFIPPNRINDVIYVNPADIDYPIAFNVLEQVSAEHRHLVASGLLGVFQKIWADSWGPRLEYVLNNAILALLEYPGSTLLGIMKMLVDKSFRQKVIKKITDPVVKSFWLDEYSKYPANFQAEAIAPIQNKVGRFLSSSMMRNIVGQVKSSIDTRKIMDEQKILLLNLSKGRIGEDNSALLGAMMVTKMQLAAMSRVEIPEKNRKDFYLYVDEFQNFATESFANILSEARKYRLNLILAHQYIEQLSETVRAAVFGNVGTLVCFRVGAEDAEFLVKEFTPRFEETDLVNLAKYNIYLKLMIDGIASEPFSATSLAPIDPPEKYEETVDKIIKVCRERYSTKREIIEDKITRWSGVQESEEEFYKTAGDKKYRPENFSKDNFKRNASSFEPLRGAATREQKDNRQGFVRRPMPKVPAGSLTKTTPAKISPATSEKSRETPDIQAPKNNSYNNTHKAICSSCGIETIVNFIPDPKRPVYCKKCLKDVKQPLNQFLTNSNFRQENTLSQKPISLKEALNLKPIDFKNKKASPAEPKKLISGQVIKF